MSEEIREAVQIIEVAYDGIEIAMKVGSGGIAAMQKAIDFLKGMLDYEKSLGRTSMRKLLMKGGDLQVLEFATADMKKVEKYAKKYGILYSVLPDADRKNGKTEIIFHTEAVVMTVRTLMPAILWMTDRWSSSNSTIAFFRCILICFCHCISHSFPSKKCQTYGNRHRLTQFDIFLTGLLHPLLLLLSQQFPLPEPLLLLSAYP